MSEGANSYHIISTKKDTEDESSLNAFIFYMVPEDLAGSFPNSKFTAK